MPEFPLLSLIIFLPVAAVPLLLSLRGAAAVRWAALGAAPHAQQIDYYAEQNYGPKGLKNDIYYRLSHFHQYPLAGIQSRRTRTTALPAREYCFNLLLSDPLILPINSQLGSQAPRNLRGDPKSRHGKIQSLLQRRGPCARPFSCPP